MIRTYMMSTILLSSILLNAMQEPIESEQHQKNWFLYLPDEVCNLIANYLTFDDFETEEEFIERTKTLLIEPESNYQLLKQKQNSSFDLPDMDKMKSSQGTITGICPNRITAVFLELFPDQNALKIIDLKSEKIIIQKDLRPENYRNGLVVSCDDYKGIALSRNANLFAILKRKDHTVGRYYDAEINIRKVNQPITDSKQETIQLTHMVKFQDKYPLIAFNKQSTHIIAHTLDGKPTIYPISSLPSEKTHANKTLKHYLFLKNVLIRDWNYKKIQK